MAEGCCGSPESCCESVPEHKMCRLTRPPNKFDVEKVKRLTSNPRHICRCCGRTANDPENLCSPTRLKT